jgi:nanoRNase/pAp phosphatase (c-di-AMP/oligoRNAs hydrolase)
LLRSNILNIPRQNNRSEAKMCFYCFCEEVDHHEFRKPFGDIAFIDIGAAAVGEMVFELLDELGVKIINNIAQNILTSLIVETSSFHLPKVRAFTFELSGPYRT